MKTKTLLLVVALFLLLAPFQASAIDGQRQGFMLNLGIGFGQGKYSSGDRNYDATGFGTDFKIGGGLRNNKVLIYYTNRALWYSPDSGGGRINGMSAAGVSYFLSPQAPSFFFSGALGLGVSRNNDTSTARSGFGFTIGAGYEFAQHFTAELTYMGTDLSGDSDPGGSDLSASSIMLTLNWLGY